MEPGKKRQLLSWEKHEGMDGEQPVSQGGVRTQERSSQGTGSKNTTKGKVSRSDGKKKKEVLNPNRGGYR